MMWRLARWPWKAQPAFGPALSVTGFRGMYCLEWFHVLSKRGATGSIETTSRQDGNSKWRKRCYGSLYVADVQESDFLPELAE